MCKVKWTVVKCFLLLLIPFVMMGQSKEIDSIYQLARSASGARQIELYSTLAITASTTHPDTAIFFAQKAIDLSDNASANDKMLALYTMGRVVVAKGSFTLGIKYLKEALQLAEKEKKDSMIALALNGIGTSTWQLGKYAEALEHHFKALGIRERIKDMKGVAVSKINIGLVYQTQGKLPLAENYIREGIDILKKNYDPGMQMAAMHTLANVYGMQGKIKEAFALDEEGIAIAEKTNNEASKSMFYDNMGNCYLYNTPPDYTKAFEHFTKTLHIDSSLGNEKQMSDSYANLGSVFFEQGKFNEAIPYLQRSVTLAEESGFAEGKLRALTMLSTAYRNSNRPNDAFAILQSAMVVKDSLVNSSSEARIAELQTVYETEKKQQQINLQQEQLSKKNFILAGIIVLSVLLALLGISAWLRYRLKQKARLQKEIMKQQELASKSVITAEENERQRIARDLHDGIGQMMSAAKMNLSAFEADMQLSNKDHSSLEKIIGLVDESCKEIRSVSHNMMPNALLKNNLATAIQDFIDKLEKKTLQTHLYTEGLDKRLDADLETVLYRIIQECVNNVIKHANATSLDISVIKDKDGISATIEDNGKGFTVAERSSFEGIGLKNIQTRTKYLKGTIDIESTPGKGTLIAINVPVGS